MTPEQARRVAAKRVNEGILVLALLFAAGVWALGRACRYVLAAN